MIKTTTIKFDEKEQKIIMDFYNLIRLACDNSNIDCSDCVFENACDIPENDVEKITNAFSIKKREVIEE